jgi:hypothetical protein
MTSGSDVSVVEIHGSDIYASPRLSLELMAVQTKILADTTIDEARGQFLRQEESRVQYPAFCLNACHYAFQCRSPWYSSRPKRAKKAAMRAKAQAVY